MHTFKADYTLMFNCFFNEMFFHKFNQVGGWFNLLGPNVQRRLLANIWLESVINDY